MMSRLLISEINKAAITNRDFIIINSNIINEKIITIFCQSGLLSGYVRYNNQIVLKIKMQYWKNWCITAKAMINVKHLVIQKSGPVSAKALMQNTKLKGNAFCSIISTDAGLKSSLNLDKGGIPLVIAH